MASSVHEDQVLDSISFDLNDPNDPYESDNFLGELQDTIGDEGACDISSSRPLESDRGKPFRRGSKRGRKKPKGAPKRALSAYNIFFQEQRPEVVKRDPSLCFEEVTRLVGQKWKTLSDSEKVKYELIAKEDAERFRQESEEYKFKTKKRREENYRRLDETDSPNLSLVKMFSMNTTPCFPSSFPTPDISNSQGTAIHTTDPQERNLKQSLAPAPGNSTTYPTPFNPIHHAPMLQNTWAPPPVNSYHSNRLPQNSSRVPSSEPSFEGNALLPLNAELEVVDPNTGAKVRRKIMGYSFCRIKKAELEKFKESIMVQLSGTTGTPYSDPPILVPYPPKQPYVQAPPQNSVPSHAQYTPPPPYHGNFDGQARPQW